MPETLTKEQTNRLDVIAKNLLVCSDRTVKEVLEHLCDIERSYVEDRIAEASQAMATGLKVLE